TGAAPLSAHRTRRTRCQGCPRRTRPSSAQNAWANRAIGPGCIPGHFRQAQLPMVGPAYGSGTIPAALVTDCFAGEAPIDAPSSAVDVIKPGPTPVEAAGIIRDQILVIGQQDPTPGQGMAHHRRALSHIEIAIMGGRRRG